MMVPYIHISHIDLVHLPAVPPSLVLSNSAHVQGLMHEKKHTQLVVVSGFFGLICFFRVHEFPASECCILFYG